MQHKPAAVADCGKAELPTRAPLPCSSRAPSCWQHLRAHRPRCCLLRWDRALQLGPGAGTREMVALATVTSSTVPVLSPQTAAGAFVTLTHDKWLHMSKAEARGALPSPREQ